MARKTKEEAEKTRNSILTAALEIIFEKGYARSTFVDIADRIHLTKGAVYWHFKNKPDLILALGRKMEAKIENTLAGISERVVCLEDLKDVLQEIILLISTDEELRRYYTIVYYRMEWTEELLPLKEFFDREEDMMVQWFLEMFKEAQLKGQISKARNLPYLSKALSAFMGGLLAYCLSKDDRKDESQVVEMGLDAFFAGLNPA